MRHTRFRKAVWGFALRSGLIATWAAKPSRSVVIHRPGIAMPRVASEVQAARCASDRDFFLQCFTSEEPASPAKINPAK